MTKNLILEIGTEEIPSRFLSKAQEDLYDRAKEEFKKERIGHGSMETMATPRRLVLSVHGLEERQQDLEEAYKGPTWQASFDATGFPTKAAEGFARSKAVAVENLEMRTVNGVDYAFAVICQKGQPVAALLPEIMKRLISSLVFPKNMFWNDPTVRFARPIRWILCLLGDDVVPFHFNGLESGRISRGHRFMGARHVEIRGADQYMAAMYDQGVIVDQRKRQETMVASIKDLEKDLGGTVELDPDLVEENLYLVENPVVFYGSFDKKYLEIPQEVLITSMKDNQKYFAVKDHNGSLMPYFVGVSNNRAVNMDLIREGNQRVLRARLEDARFFWQEDLKRPLSSRVESLKKVVYQEKLGSVYDKITWTMKFSRVICQNLGLQDQTALAERAAYLSKADLVTAMVCEFPELQGVMGRAYALKDGEDPLVAQALEDQYLPRFAGDKLPSHILGAVVGLAERLFNIVSAYKIGLQPTGSQDPYGLRRAIRCVNEILWGMELDLDLDAVIGSIADDLELDEATSRDLADFIGQRSLIQLKERGYSHNLVELALSVTGSRPLQALRLVEALTKVQNQQWFADLVMAAVRVKNILAKADASTIAPAPSQDFLIKEAETELLEAMNRTDEALGAVMARQDWNELMNLLAGLSPAVTAFFDGVMVMDQDPAVRANRLALLTRCNALFMRVGDLSKAKG